MSDGVGSPPSKSPTLKRAALAVLVRSFVVQGSWNYHTMIGSGFAFALAPGLKRLLGSSDQADRALHRHLEHFNAHPYLAGLAIGAVLRMEVDGEDPETIRRFKVAIRGPLGSLGDSLVWATWLPAAALLALSAHWAGAPGWLAAVLFLLLYNAGHIGLRLWGLLLGLENGREVGKALSRADLAGRVSRQQPIVALLIGVMAGVLLSSTGGLAASGVFWVGLAVGAFLVGLLGGHRTWRPAAIATVIAIALTATFGVIG